MKIFYAYKNICHLEEAGDDGGGGGAGQPHLVADDHRGHDPGRGETMKNIL